MRLADRISQLESVVAKIERRLGLLEKRLIEPAVQIGQTPEEAEIPPFDTPLARPEIASFPAGVPVEAAPAAEEPSQPATALFPSPFTAELELLIGGSWLNRVGVLAIIVAVAYFLKFSFDNNWIGPGGRVGLTLLGGALLLAAGEYYQRRRLSIFAQGLSGGGAAVLYLAIFSAFAIYRLVGFVPAFITMVLITIATMTLSLRYDSLAIATLGLLGGFATPFLLGGPTETGGVARSVNIGVYLYFLLLNAGVYALAQRRMWWRFGAVGLVCGFVAPVILAQAGTPQPSTAAVYFLLLTIATLLLSMSFAIRGLAWTALVGGFFLGPAGVAYLVWDRLQLPVGSIINPENLGAIKGVGFKGPAMISRTTNGGASWDGSSMIRGLTTRPSPIRSSSFPRTKAVP